MLELLEIIQSRIDPLGVQYAIGGALAMAAHGYSRPTEDVDLFVVEKSDRDRYAILQALRDAGLTTSAVMEPYHYIALDPQHVDPDVRIDVLFPEAEPDLSGVEWSTRKPLWRGGIELPVYDKNLLAIAKFYTDTAKGDSDLLGMFSRGVFDPDVVRMMIASMGDDDDLSDWDGLIATFRKRRGKRASKVRKSPGKKP